MERIEKTRKFESKNYLEFIRRLPCHVTGKTGKEVSPHHVKLKGMGGVGNDYYAIPLSFDVHGGYHHNGREAFETVAGEDIRDIAVFYMSMYIEWIEGRYNLDADESTSFMELRRIKNGITSVRTHRNDGTIIGGKYDGQRDHDVGGWKPPK